MHDVHGDRHGGRRSVVRYGSPQPPPEIPHLRLEVCVCRSGFSRAPARGPGVEREARRRISISVRMSLSLSVRCLILIDHDACCPEAHLDMAILLLAARTPRSSRLHIVLLNRAIQC